MLPHNSSASSWRREKDRIALYFGAPKIKLRSLGLPDSESQQRVIEAFAKDVFEEATQQLSEEMQPTVETLMTEQKPVDGNPRGSSANRQ